MSITDSKEAPPSYSTQAISSGPAGSRSLPTDHPPAYQIPHTYKIGAHILSPETAVVNITELKAHLALLRAFKDLRTNVEGKSPAELNLPVVVESFDEKKRWSWFVGLAVER